MAMGLAYDEDLTDNTFFRTLRKEFADLFYKAILEGCIICVPRSGSFSNYSITLDDVLGHILLPSDEMPESHFNTLSGKEVKISNRNVNVTWDLQCQLSVQILFEETYYTEDMFKYKVVCIEHSLEPKLEGAINEIFSIGTLRDCIDFLNYECESRALTDLIDTFVSDFLSNKECFEKASLQTLKELTLALYEKCLEEALKDSNLRTKSRHSDFNLKIVKLAIETYVHHAIYTNIFKSICFCTAEDNAVLNKVIRNCTDLQLKDLEIRAEFHELIPKAKSELKKLTGYGTVMGKLGCLKKMITILARDPESGGMLAADDLLPIIIFIILKVNITNWFAHLCYLQNFRFSSLSSSGHDEDEFLIATLEAALQHINTGVFLSKACADNPLRSNQGLPNRKWQPNHSNLAILFEHIAQGNITEIKNAIECETGANFSRLQLCHPLCCCDKCRDIVEVNDPTVHSKDETGLTALHVAAMYGQPAVVDYLLTHNVDVDSGDNSGRTPLHCALQYGHQSCLLLLIQSGADVNAADNQLNTPLHVGAAHGHTSCIKALIYHCEHEATKLLINAQNNEGETALHNAARWGFLSVIEILIAYEADPSIVNRRRLSSFQVANNSKVVEILTHSRPKFKCGLNVKTINFDFLEEGFEKCRISGEIPLTSKMSKKVDKMLRAIAHGDVNLACFYLGLDPITDTANKCHPLCTCLGCKGDGNSAILQTFQDKVGVNMCDSEGFTALHIAAYHGVIDLTKLLTVNGAILNVQNRKFLTPLIIACQQQRVQIATYLLESGCSVNMQDCKGNTALHYACASSHSNRRLIESLLKYKPKLSIYNKAGRTALQEAEARMSLGIVNILKDVSQ